MPLPGGQQRVFQAATHSTHLPILSRLSLPLFQLRSHVHVCSLLPRRQAPTSIPFVSSRSPRLFRSPHHNYYSGSAMSTPAPADVPQRRFQRPAIFICDIQDKFRTAIWNFDAVVQTATKVLRTAHLLGLPVHVTTQNGGKLGNTVDELAEYLEPTVESGAPSEVAPSSPSGASSSAAARVYPNVDKTRFSMWVPEVAARFAGQGAAEASTSPQGKGQKTVASLPHEIILIGIESHICITQTAIDLLAAGHRVYVLADGVSSCNRQEVDIALARLRVEGATVTTSESVLYELLGDAKTPEFKGIVKVVKDTGTQTRQVLQALL